MEKVKRLLRTLFGLAIVVVVGAVFVNYYSFIFSRKVKGVIEAVERVQLNVALMQDTGGGANVNPQLFSFSIAIRQPDGEIVTASSEDRQWATAQKGNCVEAVYYPYPPWNVMKSGTYFNARLDRMYDCSSEAAAH